ncbi:hypothetical protein BU24DRAFT_50950 [Aaosphaeria arxii CBS 175.79]|uniref:Transmembrane protein n=1 Tax=Aaosphaeria arxii CBS 175.79 TaxID=1450172 RepID=A0A6A5XDN8_9PLEO|nr:uncharacterized protein BU24DRAFT_50950 [Aaosphaeria arxii CBS 175.79]KAF2011009.1 hypothetical protein BU24DRAFT_50950 [Aaosphaeria arxii CBS 175.79]
MQKEEKQSRGREREQRSMGMGWDMGANHSRGMGVGHRCSSFHSFVVRWRCMHIGVPVMGKGLQVFFPCFDWMDFQPFLNVLSCIAWSTVSFALLLFLSLFLHRYCFIAFCHLYFCRSLCIIFLAFWFDTV